MNLQLRVKLFQFILHVMCRGEGATGVKDREQMYKEKVGEKKNQSSCSVRSKMTFGVSPCVDWMPTLLGLLVHDYLLLGLHS